MEREREKDDWILTFKKICEWGMYLLELVMVWVRLLMEVKSSD